MDPYYVAAAILAWLLSVTAIVALFIGRDRMITDLKRVWAEADQ